MEEIIKLDLGGGIKKTEGFINIDKYQQQNLVDLVMDLDSPTLNLPYKNSSISEIRSYHFFEHIDNIFPLINECYRVLKVDGIMDIITPLGHTASWGDPTHKRAFTEETWHYFTQNPPGGYINPEIIGKWKIILNDWTERAMEDTEKVVYHKRRELHAIMQPIKS